MVSDNHFRPEGAGYFSPTATPWEREFDVDIFALKGQVICPTLPRSHIVSICQRVVLFDPDRGRTSFCRDDF